jgi:hypothetical protein
MGILTTLVDKARTVVSGAISAAVGPKPLELRRVSGEKAAETVYQSLYNGFQCSVFQDYPDSPWSWTVERDGNLVAMRGTNPTYEAAEQGLYEWLTESAPVDLPPRAA